MIYKKITLKYALAKLENKHINKNKEDIKYRIVFISMFDCLTFLNN